MDFISTINLSDSSSSFHVDDDFTIIDMIEVPKEMQIINSMNLANDHQHLIELCLETKNNAFISSAELRQYGQIALKTAALEFNNKGQFRPFALKRIEFMMNRAIAEANCIEKLKNNTCDNDELGYTFECIQKTYCYN